MTRRAHELIGDLRAIRNLERLDEMRRHDGDYTPLPETDAERDARMQSVARLRAKMIADSLRHEVASGAWKHKPRPPQRRSLGRYVLPVLLCIAAGVVIAIVADAVSAVSSQRDW